MLKLNYSSFSFYFILISNDLAWQKKSNWYYTSPCREDCNAFSQSLSYDPFCCILFESRHGLL